MSGIWFAKREEARHREIIELLTAVGEKTERTLVEQVDKVLTLPVAEEVHFGIYREYVKHEDDLINNRLSWNVTIQGFLFAAYTFSLQKIGDIRLGLLNKDIDPKRIGPLKVLHTLSDLHFLLAALAFTGIVVSMAVYLSIRAARLAISELENRWHELHDSYAPKGTFEWWPWYRNYLKGRETAHKTHGPLLPGLIGGGHPAAHWLGFYAPTYLPVLLVLVWVFLLVDALLDVS